MSDIKLTYFESRGRAEISRLILSYSGAKFTDERLTGEQFGALKSSLAYGQMPILNYKGQVLYQSITIARYARHTTLINHPFVLFRFLAHEFGLAGKNNLENAQADEVVDAVSDLITVMFKALGDEEEVEKVLDDNWPKGLVRID